MKIALLSDIHGNDVALDAVLADIEQRGGVDAYWVLGDLVAIGHAPIKVLERLAALPDAHFIRGNTDRYVCAGDRPPPTFADVKNNLDLLPTLVQVEADFVWTQGAVTIAGWLDWLKQLPVEFRTELPDGTQVLCVHAAPGRDSGYVFMPDIKPAVAAERIGACDADLICVGHTHHPVNLQFNQQRVVNPGSVSNPPVGTDNRAAYAIITADEQGYEVEHRRVAYDYESVIAALEKIMHPAAAFIIKHYHE